MSDDGGECKGPVEVTPENRLKDVTTEEGAPPPPPPTPEEPKIFVFVEKPDGGLSYEFRGFIDRDQAKGWFDRLINRETLDRLTRENLARRNGS